MSSKNNTESFINNLNKGDPSMEPWGTPACTFFAEINFRVAKRWNHLSEVFPLEMRSKTNFAIRRIPLFHSHLGGWEAIKTRTDASKITRVRVSANTRI